MNVTTLPQARRWKGELLVYSGESRRDLIQKLTATFNTDLAHGFVDYAVRLAKEFPESHRLAVIADNPIDLAGKIKRAVNLLDSSDKTRFNLANKIFYGRAEDYINLQKTAFLFPGYGARSLNILEDLYVSFPFIRKWFDGLDQVCRTRFLHNPLLFSASVDKAGGKSPESPFFDTIDAILVADLAMYTLVRGLTEFSCDAMLGHSFGENAMLIASGAVKDYRKVFDIMGHILGAMRTLEPDSPRSADPTAMLAVTASSREMLNQFQEGNAESVFLALDNCPQQAVFCGRTSEISKIEKILKKKTKISFRISQLVQPVHTPFFPIPLKRLRQIYEEIEIKPPALPAYSCATIAPFPKEPEEIRDLLASQWISPVRFRETIENLYAEGTRTFIEVGPGGHLTGFVRDTLRGSDIFAIPTNLENRKTLHQIQICLANLFVRGHHLNLGRFFEDRSAGTDSHQENLDTGSLLSPPSSVPNGSKIPDRPRCENRLQHASIADFPRPDKPASPSNDLFLLRLTALDSRARRRVLVTHLLEQIAEVIELPTPDLIELDRGFFDQGMSSIEAVELVERLQKSLAHPLPETLLFDYPTVDQVVNYLNSILEPDLSSHGSDRLEANLDAKCRGDLDPKGVSEAIAIIGMGCRFPGNADNPDAFWDLLLHGKDAVTEVPVGRWDIDRLNDTETEAKGNAHIRYGGFLEKIQDFDSSFFGISPVEAVTLDPQQRLILEVTWEALENAGLNPMGLADTTAGVFIGISSTDYAQRLSMEERLRIKGYLATGNSHSTAAGRISFVLGLTGPCLAVDTACSSSLVSVHLACQSLRLRESEIAIAGGVNLLISPETSIYLSIANALSEDGRCKTFDATADGYVRGEGCGAIILKRLSDAIGAGDNVLAVIRGSAINHDGHTSGLTVPNGPSQQAVIRRALANAAVLPDQIDYVETHGTATSLGDPIEVQALGHVFKNTHSRNKPLLLGAVKTNIGHLEAAAGIAGLIKTVLQLQYGQIVQSLHFKTANPKVNWEELPLRVATEAVPWPVSPHPRTAGLSAFGISGTNAHVIIQEFLKNSPSLRSSTGSMSVPGSRSHHLLTLSAKSETALNDLARNYSGYLTNHTKFDFADVCYTSNTGRAHFKHRLAFVGSDLEDTIEEINHAVVATNSDDEIRGSSVSPTRPKISFLFTGQGAQYVNMGRQLYDAEPIFRAVLEKCSDLLHPFMDMPLLEVLFQEPLTSFKEIGSDKTALLNQTAYTQPALFALEYALTELWKSWGIEPDLVIGHSIGEYAAACVAGVFSLEDGLRLVAARGRFMQSLPAGGAMLAVKASQSRAKKLLDLHNIELSMAAVNGPQSVVLSGPEASVGLAEKIMATGGTHCTMLNVSHAFHSFLTDPILDDFQGLASQITYHPPKIPLISNLTGQRADRNITSPEYWVRQLRQTVRFADGMHALQEEGCDIFLEIGPKPVIAGMGQDCIPKKTGPWLASLHPPVPEQQQILESLGKLYVAGMNIDWAGLHDGRNHCKVRMPTYPFQREPFWIEPDFCGEKQLPYRLPAKESRGLLGDRLDLPGLDHEKRFESHVSTTRIEFLRDYRIFGRKPMPISAFLAMTLSAGRELNPTGSLAIEEFEVHHPLFINYKRPTTIQTVLTPREGGGYGCRIYSLHTQNDGAGAAWELHVESLIRKTIARNDPFSDDLNRFRGEGFLNFKRDHFYETCRQMGFDYGESFKVIENLWVGEYRALGLITLPSVFAEQGDEYQLHPAMLDGCFQALGAALFQNRGVYIVKGIESFELYGGPAHHLYAIASCEPPGERGENIRATVTLLDRDSMRIIAEIEGILYTQAQPDLNDGRGEGEPFAKGSRALEELRETPSAEQNKTVLKYLKRISCKILRLPRGKVLEIDQTFRQMCFDSIMALYLRNQLQTDFGVDIPVMKLMEDQTIARLAETILSQISEQSDDGGAGRGKTGKISPPGEENIEWVEGEL
jgi:acyl transferase domain-containing protein